ncbi:MAG TPA: hypothetical protein PKD41_04090 [Solidesulfovibrio sp.]|nr:hypothetical protein [Solidesulfovibrio sp.]
MNAVYCRRVIEALWLAFSRKASGSTLLWAIGTLVLLSVLGATVALMSPTALQSKLEQEAGMRAYYNANAGLNYILGMQQASQLNGMNFAAFVNSLGDTGDVAYNLDQSDFFSYRLGNIKYNGSNGSYQIAKLVGSVKNPAGDAPYGYILYGGGKGNSLVQNYTTNGGQQNSPAWSKNVLSNYGGELKVSQNAIINNDTSIYGKTGVTLDQGVTFNDDIDIVGDGNVKISQNANFKGLNNTICADGNLTFDQGVVYAGRITATNDIKFSQNNRITGTVYAVTGGITCDQGVYVKGELNSKNDIKFSQNTTIIGDVYTFGNVSCDQGVTISGTIYKTSTKTVSGCSAKTDLLPAGYVIKNQCDYSVTTPTLTKNLPATPPGSSPAVSPLPPGNYGPIKYDQNTSLVKLSQGNYYINSLQFDQGCSICLDLSSGGNINIYISDSIKLSQNFAVYIIVPGGSSCVPMLDKTVDAKLSAKVYLETNNSFTLDQGGQWFGSILANKDIKFSQNARLIGSYASINGPVNVDQGFVVTYIQSGYSGSPN